MIAALGVLAGCAGRDARWIYGVHWYSDDPLSGEVEELTGGKGIYVLEIVLTDPGAPAHDRWPAQKAAFEAIHAKSHTLIIRVQADWGRIVPHPGDPYSTDAFVDDCRRMAEDLRWVCHIWQIGNEMNIAGEWGGQLLPPDAYVDVYRRVRAAIHSVWSPLGPQRVLLGPVSPGGIVPDVRPVEGLDYLARILERLSPGECDGLALHAYAEPCPNWECGLEGFQDIVTEQLELMDEMGFRRLPVYITEFNKHMPLDKPGEEIIAAGFIRQAYRWLDEWNSGRGRHNIITACWFVYPAGRGWDDYSLQFWHTPGEAPDKDAWAAFQAAAREGHRRGRRGGGSPPRPAQALWFHDDFDGPLDQARPLPDWKVRAAARSRVQTRDGWLILSNRDTATTSACEIITRGHVFGDFKLWTALELADADTRDPRRAHASAEVLIRATDTGGYALVLEAERNAISLRDRRTGEVVGDCRCGVALGGQQRFEVAVRAAASAIHAAVDRVVAEGRRVRVAEWTVEDDRYRWGWVGLRADRIAEVQAPFFTLAGPDFERD
ncbi:MAG: hypothetical protein Kow0059_13370 [Candidatus Sumerlaeia bacterium]